MASEVRGESPYWTVQSSNGGKGVYHLRRHCIRLKAAESIIERPASYIRWHDLELCAYCDPLTDTGSSGNERTGDWLGAAADD